MSYGGGYPPQGGQQHGYSPYPAQGGPQQHSYPPSQGQHSYPPPQSQHGYPPQGGQPPPPMVPPPWRAEWEPHEHHYLYINQQTGQRTREFPGQYPPNAPGYHRGPPPPQGYGPPPPGYGPPQQPVKPGHNWKDMAIGGAGGALVGGFLTHEWDEHKEHEKEDKWRREERSQEDEIARLRRENEGLERDERREENRPVYIEERRDYDDGGYRQDNTTIIENNYVDERRDDIYQQDTFVEQRDDYRDDYRRDEYREDEYRRDDYRDQDQGLVADVVDDVSGWAGREEGRVERFGDGVEDSFDQGRDEERYENRW